MKRVVFILCLLLMGCFPSLAQGGKSYDIIITEGNTLLSILPATEWGSVESLRIRGIMYSEDLKVIEGCKNLKYLDLSLAYTTEEKKSKGNYYKKYLEEVARMLSARGGKKVVNVIEQVYTDEVGKMILKKLDVTKSASDCLINFAFLREMPNLETLILPIWAGSTPDSGISKCPALNKIILPPFLKSIGEGCFSYLPELHTISFPKSLLSIQRYAFKYTHLWEVDLSQCKGWKDTSSNYRPDCFLLRDPKDSHKRTLKLPEGVEECPVDMRPGDELFLPTSFVTNATMSFTGNWDGCILHMTSPSVSNDFEIVAKNLTIYIPKGSLTSYYPFLKAGTNILEESSPGACDPEPKEAAPTPQKAYDIILTEGNSILNYLPINAFETVESLRIQGIMYASDYLIVAKCKNLKYLDLFMAYITNVDEKHDASFTSFKTEIVKLLQQRKGEHVLYKIEQTYTPEYGQGVIKSLNISKAAKDCKVFGGEHFNNMQALETVILPVWARLIGKEVFNECPVLKNITLPPFLERIYNNSFQYLPELHTISFPKTITRIDNGAFKHTHLWEIDLSQCTWPELKSVGEDFFKPDPNYHHKRIVKLPQGMQYACNVLNPGDEVYLPSTFISNNTNPAPLYGIALCWHGCVIHLTHPIPTRDLLIRSEDITVYVPKGSKDNFSKECFLEGTPILEE